MIEPATGNNREQVTKHRAEYRVACPRDSAFIGRHWQRETRPKPGMGLPRLFLPDRTIIHSIGRSPQGNGKTQPLNQLSFTAFHSFPRF